MTADGGKVIGGGTKNMRKGSRKSQWRKPSRSWVTWMMKVKLHYDHSRKRW